VYCPSEGTYQGTIGTVHRPDSVGQSVTKYVKLQVPYRTENKFPSLERRELVMEPKGEFTARYVSSTNERTESTDPLTH
jgi:hypothetical protein